MEGPKMKSVKYGGGNSTLFYLAQEEFLKEGTTPIEDIHRSEGKLEGFNSNLLNSYSRALDI